MARILVIDDDVDLVEACQLVLTRAGHEVRGAYSAGEGAAAVAAEEPDLLVLDVMMEAPDDGIALARTLRRGGFSRPILMLTSIGAVTGLHYGRDDQMLPVDDFVEKPVAPAALVARVEALLQERVQPQAKEG
jgi:DNA-binding response OmpR family regulator